MRAVYGGTSDGLEKKLQISLGVKDRGARTKMLTNTMLACSWSRAKTQDLGRVLYSAGVVRARGGGVVRW